MSDNRDFNIWLARHLVNGTRRHFSALHRDYLQEKREYEMSSGTINDSNKLGTRADGVAMKNDAVNSGSQQPNELTGQSGAVNTSETTSGLTAGSQVPVAIPPISRESDPYSKDVSTAFSTDAFKSQASPRGETNDQLEGVGG